MDTFYAIDVDKSIQKQRLVYKLTAGIVLEYIFSPIFAILPMGLVTLPTISKLSNVSHISIYYILICVAFDTWMILNIILLNAFVKVKGKTIDINRKDIINTLSCSYTLDNLDASDSNMVRDVRRTRGFSFGRVITCIMHDDCIYLNVTTLLKDDMLSFYSGVFNYVKCRRITKVFTELQARRQNQ